MDKILFREEQRFNNWWLRIILLSAFIISTTPFLFGIYVQEVLGEPWGNNPAGTTTLVFILIFNLLLFGGISIYIVKMRLIVEIRQNGIWYKYPPQYAKWRHIKKEDIDRFELRVFKPVVEYGGWGIKGEKSNKSLTVKGNNGLQIYFKDGKKLLIGTQRKQGMIYAVEKMMNKI
ncbi:MAG: hypothetical protein JXR61_10895 [Prolixibacteraceae bacterium]|nr:hypothetical protein [Prolixibacteraceae bacterium]